MPECFVSIGPFSYLRVGVIRSWECGRLQLLSIGRIWRLRWVRA